MRSCWIERATNFVARRAMGLTLLAILPLPWVLDALFRWVWSRAARRPTRETEGVPLQSVVALVPSRSEGEHVRPTLESLIRAQGSLQLRIFLVLDGPDPAAEEVARELGVAVLVKEQPGPAKGAALRFAAEQLRETIQAADAVLVLDVGSRVTPEFFSHLRWPPGVAAMQAPLRGEGSGPGEAAGLSERLAQDVWDRGKQNLGWAVKLRGTGTLFRPQVFLALTPHLTTQVEDTEASLLLSAQGLRTILAPEAAVVTDEKPGSTAEASRQRARWLMGQLALLWYHSKRFFPFFARRPLEALSWLGILLSRPLSLTVPLRVLIGTVLA
ncbi:MAG: glycosyltransferase family 2 protein, partial [Thermoanaerobaculum sp.]|nr:glycosyltransferase family 2 protein [Thermoanaerobaculum sp.]